MLVAWTPLFSGISPRARIIMHSVAAGRADAVRIAAHDGGYRLDRRSPH